MIYHNTKQNTFYYPIYRCGSSVLLDISKKCDYLKEYHDEEGFRLIDLNRECPIYIIYRHPETRFKSGLQITIKRFLMNQPDLLHKDILPMLDEGYDALFQYGISFLDNIATKDIPYVSGHWDREIIRPFHLYDSHLDHMLWRPLILKAYGYNVVMIPINEYDDHLGRLYPTAYQQILDSHDRPETFKTNNKNANKLWEIYKKVFVDNLYYDDRSARAAITFKTWMDEEIKIFDTIEKFRSAPNFKFASEKMIKKLFENKLYFSDMYAPSMIRIHKLLDILHNHKEPIEDFKLFYEKNVRIRSQLFEYMCGDYVKRI